MNNFNLFAHLRLTLIEVTPSDKPMVGDAGLGNELSQLAHYNKQTGESISILFSKHSTGYWCVGWVCDLNASGIKKYKPVSTQTGMFASDHTAKIWAVGELLKILGEREDADPNFCPSDIKIALMKAIGTLRQHQIAFERQ